MYAKTKMNHEDQQKRDEVEVFRRFANVCPLNICLDFVQTQQPPKPDIICQLADGGKIEFELSEAVDQQYNRKTKLSINQTLVGMRDYYESLPVGKKKEFKRLYGNATIHFKFKESATKKE